MSIAEQLGARVLPVVASGVMRMAMSDGHPAEAVSNISTIAGQTVANVSDQITEAVLRFTYAMNNRATEDGIEGSLQRVARITVNTLIERKNLELHSALNFQLDIRSELELRRHTVLALKDSHAFRWIKTHNDELSCGMILSEKLWKAHSLIRGSGQIAVPGRIYGSSIETGETWCIVPERYAELPNTLSEGCQLAKDFIELDLRDTTRKARTIARLLEEGAKENDERKLKVAVYAIGDNTGSVNENFGDGDHWFGLSIAGHTGFRAIHWAASRGHVQAIKILATAPGFIVDVPNGYNDPATITALSRLRSERLETVVNTVQALLEEHADPNAEGEKGSRPLHYAIGVYKNNCRGIVEVLLRHKANPRLIDRSIQKTAIEYARSLKLSDDIIRLLEQAPHR